MVNSLLTNSAKFLLLISLGHTALADSSFAINTRYIRLNTTITPYSELRQHNLIRQGWDTSCGAAAMATLMTFHHLKPVSEAAIALTLLRNTDPDRVRARGGFSLLDLKRYTQAVGYRGSGFGGMTLDDLENFAIPAILPIRIRNFDHFVVYRKRIGNRVLIGDPAFGNLTLKVAEFENMWQSKVAFYVLTQQEATQLAQSKRAINLSPMSPLREELAIPNQDYSNHIIHRLPIIPLTRSIQKFTPE
ncbi:MAG: C39 family peptidase [Gammaproteobacteria bacterium]|nr:C39 family peptidase [Gammaproteobacteria bacterium]